MINLGLARISRLLSLLAKDKGTPEYLPPWKAIHIAGTNGKGSVAAYISTLLNRTELISTAKVDVSSSTTIFEAGKNVNTSKELRNGLRKEAINVGRFTSPHFIDSWDCIQINNESVPGQAFERVRSKTATLATQLEQELLQKISSASSSPKRDQAQHDARLTEFELLTATAFELFSDPELGPCDISVIECGLGGRLDATNALPSSAIQFSVITRIGLDHLDVLGGSLHSIVREKCGILRENIPVVIDGDNDPEVLEMIRSEVVCKFGREQAEAALHIARADDLNELIIESMSRADDDTTKQKSQRLLDLMPHQRSNLAVALKVYELLGSHHNNSHSGAYPTPITVSMLEKVVDDFSKTYPGRLQWLQPGWLGSNSGSQFPKLNDSTILLDGAHNAQSAQVLRACVDNKLQKRPSTPAVMPKESIESVFDDFAERLPILNTTSATTGSTITDNTIHNDSNTSTFHRKVIWILAISSGKDTFSLLETLIRSPHDEIIFTTFSPVQGMPWVSATPLASLVSSAEVLDLQYHVKGAVGDIIEALEVAEELLAKYHNHRYEVHHQHQHQPPLVVIAGSLYLVSDFLRFHRDGRDAFMRYWHDHEYGHERLKALEETEQELGRPQLR